MNKKLLLSGFVILFMMFVVVLGCEPPAEEPEKAVEEPEEEVEKAEEPEDAIVWEAASGWPRGTLAREQFEVLAEYIEEESEGELELTITGPETWPGPDQITALSDGTFDIIVTVTAYYLEESPAASFNHFAWGSIDELRDAGVFSLLDEIHREEYDSMFLDQFPFGAMHLYLSEPIDSIDDFSGLRIRVPALYAPGIGELGATTMWLSDDEAVDGLRTGTIDGAITSSNVYTSWRYTEVAPYVVYPPHALGSAVVFANMDSFNELPEHLQEAVEQAVEKARDDIYALAEEEKEEMLAEWNEAGVEAIKLSEEEWEKYAAAYTEAYLQEMVIPEESPEVAEQIESYLEEFSVPEVEELPPFLEELGSPPAGSW